MSTAARKLQTDMKKPNRQLHIAVSGSHKSINGDLSKENYRYHNLTPEQWHWAVSMIREFELNEDGARILIEEIKKGNFVFD